VAMTCRAACECVNVLSYRHYLQAAICPLPGISCQMLFGAYAFIIISGLHH